MEKHMKRGLFIVFLLVLMLTSCVADQTPATTASPVTITLPVGYVPNVQFAPLYVAIEKGYYNDEGLEVSLDYSMENDNTVLVGTGDLKFAIVSGEQVLLARAQDLPVVYVLAWYQQYPVGIVAKTSSEINSVADLRGKKIGLPGLYGANYIGGIALLNSSGLEQSDVTLDSIGYNQVASLVADQDDAVVIYAANEPLQLDAAGVDYVLFKTSDAVDLVANGLITNENTIANDPDLVQKMTSATFKGIQYTADHPDEAYEICKKFVDNLTAENEELQKQILQNSIELWNVSEGGYSNPAAWENMQELLLKMGLLSTPLDLSAAYSNSFLPQ
jgi:NitT/TauT family transport system substrate-binding protein